MLMLFILHVYTNKIKYIKRPVVIFEDLNFEIFNTM